MKLGSNLGMMLLGIWLVLTGLIPLLNLNLQIGMLMNALAVAAGASILMNR